MSGTAIKITFEHAGVVFSDEITVDADSGKDTETWDVTLTTKDGKAFSLARVY